MPIYGVHLWLPKAHDEAHLLREMARSVKLCFEQITCFVLFQAATTSPASSAGAGAAAREGSPEFTPK